MNKTTLYAGGLLLLVGAGLLIWYVRPTPTPCQMSEYSRLVGVGVDAQVQALKGVQGKLGLTDAEVRGFDTLLRDYAAKYDAACRDVTNDPPLLSVPQYQCMRQKMDASLDVARRISQATEAAKSSTDPSLQRAQLDAAYKQLSEAQTGFDGGCSTTVSVSPRKLLFQKGITISAIKLLNVSGSKLNWGITDYPQCFALSPESGSIDAGETVNIVVRRTLDPVPEGPMRAAIKIGFQRDVNIEFGVAEESTVAWRSLADGMQERNVETAMHVIGGAVSREIEGDLPRGILYSAAGDLLAVAGEFNAAATAYSRAIAQDEGIARQPATVRSIALLTAASPEAATLYAKLRNEGDWSAAASKWLRIPPNADPPDKDEQLHSLVLPQPFAVNGKLLAPGAYELRAVKTLNEAKVHSVPENVVWVEFRQEGVVKGVALASRVSEAVPLTPSKGLAVESLDIGDYVRLMFRDGQRELLLHVLTSEAAVRDRSASEPPRIKLGPKG